MSNDERSDRIEKLKVLRAGAKGSLTRIKNVVTSKKDTITLPDLECRLGILESYFQQLLTYHTQYEGLVPDDDSNAEYRGECEETYISAKTLIKSLINDHKAASPSFLPDLNQNQSIIFRSSSSNLQKIKLPIFNGKYAAYPNFIGIFNKTVHNNENYETIEKCNILVNSLEGLAKNAVKEYRITEENYPKILKQLEHRFDNKTLYFQELIADLFELPKINKPSSTSLRSLVDNVNAIFNSMLSVGNGEDVPNAMIIYVVMGKLDPGSQNKWEDSIDFTRLLTWDDCSKVLSKRCQFLECRDSKFSSSSFSHSPNNNRSHNKSSSRYNSTSLTASGSHRSNSVAERFSKVKGLNLCINCLCGGHTVKKCQTKWKCRVCSNSHHTLLHRYNTSSLATVDKNNSPASASNADTLHDNTPHLLSCLTHSKDGISCNAGGLQSQVILATAQIHVRDKNGIFVPARALLDSGSQLNFISSRLAYSLGLKMKKTNSNIYGIARSKSKIRLSTHSVVKSRFNNFLVNLDMLVLNSIAAEMPEPSIKIDHWQIPKNIQLADPEFFVKKGVDMLIGAEIFFDILCVGQVKLGTDLPSLQKTLFGWIVSGKYNTTTNTFAKDSFNVIQNSEEAEDFQEIHQLVKDFWKIECFENTCNQFTQEQGMCRDIYYNTVRTSPDGRLVVKFPFKPNYTELGSSKIVAGKRFYNLEKRLNSEPELKRQCTEFLNEYLDLDHMQLVPEAQEHLVKYYLPHHCVFKPDSTTTKIRVVFDGSCKTNTGLSLNDVLLVGHVVQDDLFTILLKFRCCKYALKADIAKMYRQFLLDEPDSFYQCILWRDRSDQPVRTYRLKTVTYGTASASHHATESLLHLASKFEKGYPLGADVIRKGFYVDDLLTGGNSVEELKRIRGEVNLILSSAGLELRKWYSNNLELLSEIPEQDQEKLININESAIIKTLGISWQPSSDQFKFSITDNLFSQQKITKRVVLSDMSRLYDPLGLINPIIVKAKVFLQGLWILKINWDESLPTFLHEEWSIFRKNLALLNRLEIPRYVLEHQSSTRIELHGFCDASSRAYGCCIYVRSIDTEGHIRTHLLTAKSKIAPIKTQTIPRLELCAALLLVNLLDKINKIITFKVDDVILWSDSEIVLDWLSAHPSNWVVFVANRVSVIQQLSENFTWKHVPTKSNAADILSRGATTEELLTSSWFIGPDFLRKSIDHWPQQKTRNKIVNSPDKRNCKKISMIAQSRDNDLHTLLSKFSNYNKTINTFAYIIKFFNNCRKSSRNLASSALTVEERDHALLKIIQIIQHHHYHAEIESLKSGHEIPNKSILKNFNPFLQVENGVTILKVGGRLRNAGISNSAKYPIFLPSDDSFVKLLINHYHQTNLHAGPQALLATIRQRFWITNGRAVVSRVVKRCIRCFKFKPRLTQQLMGDLPKPRLDPGHAFLNTGVDFCGPVTISHGVRSKLSYKAYISVFVCFSTHAVHLDLVSSLTADAFIACLKRFVSRRGLCRNLYCDNATNFVGARHILQDLREQFKNQQFLNEITNFATNQGIEFHHIPARCPHFGGLWEAAVKSAKFHLNRCCYQLKFTFEEMVTLLAQVESILNSRPLTPFSSDPSDDNVLTPGHFLVGRPLNSIPEPIYNINNVSRLSALKRFQRISAILQNFWERWSKEYILNLQRRNKWTSSSKNLIEGALVLMADDNLPPQHWSIARVIKLHPGKDNIVRVAEVKCRSRTFKRHINSLAIIPIDY